jgi:probable rRNA maturation factor
MTRQAPTVAVTVQNVAGDADVPAAAQLRKWARSALGSRLRGELTVRIVSVEESAALNSEYRGKKGPTNVLSFPADTPPATRDELSPCGDVVICAAVVAREAREQGKPAAAHWAHMVIHGTLHLQGYDHEHGRDATVMEARERVLLAELGFPDPYSIK